MVTRWNAQVWAARLVWHTPASQQSRTHTRAHATAPTHRTRAPPTHPHTHTHTHTARRATHKLTGVVRARAVDGSVTPPGNTTRRWRWPSDEKPHITVHHDRHTHAADASDCGSSHDTAESRASTPRPTRWPARVLRRMASQHGACVDSWRPAGPHTNQLGTSHMAEHTEAASAGVLASRMPGYSGVAATDSRRGATPASAPSCVYRAGDCVRTTHHTAHAQVGEVTHG